MYIANNFLSIVRIIDLQTQAAYTSQVAVHLTHVVK